MYLNFMELQLDDLTVWKLNTSYDWENKAF